MLPLIALHGATTYLDYQQGKQYADAANKARKQQIALTTKVASAEALASYAAIAARRQEERVMAFQSIEAVTRDAARRTGTLITAAGESGVKGGSVRAAVGEFARIQLENTQSILDAELYATEQYGRDVEAVRMRQWSEIANSVYGNAVQPPPSLFNAFMSFTAGMLQIKGQHDKMQPVGATQPPVGFLPPGSQGPVYNGPGE